MQVHHVYVGAFAAAAVVPDTLLIKYHSIHALHDNAVGSQHRAPHLPCWFRFHALTQQGAELPVGRSDQHFFICMCAMIAGQQIIVCLYSPAQRRQGECSVTLICLQAIPPAPCTSLHVAAAGISTCMPLMLVTGRFTASLHRPVPWRGAGWAMPQEGTRKPQSPPKRRRICHVRVGRHPLLWQGREASGKVR